MSSRVRGMLRLREDGDTIDQEMLQMGVPKSSSKLLRPKRNKREGNITQRGKGQYSECLPKTKRAPGGVFRLLSSSISRDWLSISLPFTILWCQAFRSF